MLISVSNFSANAVLDSSDVSPVYLAAQVIKQLGKYLHSQPENILGGSPERAAAPGDQGGGRPHGPGRGRHGAPARRRADGLPGLHQVDGQGGTWNKYLFTCSRINDI